MSVEITNTQFVDTNIFVYAHDLSAGRKQEIAKDLMIQCWEEKTGCLSIQVMQELYVTLTQKIKQPLDRGEAQHLIADLSHWTVHTPGSKDVLDAIDLQGEYSLSFWEAFFRWW